MRVLITGATGFVGGAMARALAAEGAEIHALARPAADRSSLEGLDVTWHAGDVTAADTLSRAVPGMTAVIHAAGPLGKFGVPEAIYQRTHVDGTRMVLEAVKAAASSARVLFVSSTGVLGPSSRDLAEDAPYLPTNAYERAKTDAEKVALDFASRGLDVVVARPAFLYGPGDKHVLKLFQTIGRGRFFYIGGGHNFCHPTFINDAVAGMLLALHRGERGGVYNITGPRPATLRDLAEAIAHAIGVAPPRFSAPRWLAAAGVAGLEWTGKLTGAVPPLSRAGVAFFSESRRYSFQRAREVLGYNPRYELHAGVKCAVEWYRQHGWL